MEPKGGEADAPPSVSFRKVRMAVKKRHLRPIEVLRRLVSGRWMYEPSAFMWLHEPTGRYVHATCDLDSDEVSTFRWLDTGEEVFSEFRDFPCFLDE